MNFEVTFSGYLHPGNELCCVWIQREGGADSALPDRLVWKRDPGIGVNPAVIQAPDGMEGNRHDSNQRLDAEEDREVCLLLYLSSSSYFSLLSEHFMVWEEW